MQELTQLTYNKVKPKVKLVYKPVLRLELKDQISYLDKICIIWNLIVTAKKVTFDKQLGI